MNRDKISVLHCGPCGSRSSWGGGSVRSTLEADITPAHTKVSIISLRHACLAAGLLDDVRKKAEINWATLGALIDKKWDGSVERFLVDAEGLGVSLERADAVLVGQNGAVIGWNAADEELALPGRIPYGVCPDINRSLAVLGRCVGDVFIASRAPDYAWATLFGRAFGCDDQLGEVTSLEEQPWSRFAWSQDGGFTNRWR